MNNDEEKELISKAMSLLSKKALESRWGKRSNPQCPYCDSFNTIRKNQYKNTKSYNCKDCQKYFSKNIESI
jgi:transposase-like protein